MIRKKNFEFMKFLLVAIIFLVGIGFVNSVVDEVTDFGKLMGLPEGEITGEGIEYQKLSDQDVRLTFVNENANVNVKGNSFKNIVSQNEAGFPTFIELDERGNILKANFKVNEEGGTYVFGNTEINAPPNSKVFFDEKTRVSIKLPEGSTLGEFPKSKDISLPTDYITTIEGENIKLPSGDIVSGKLGFENEQAFVALKDRTVINGVELGEHDRLYKTYSEKINTFFDGKKHEGDYVSFDLENKKLILSSNTNNKLVINFKESNPFIRIDKGDQVAMRALFGSEIEIQNRDSQGLIPRVITKGDFVIIDEDYKSFVYYGDEIRMNKFSLLTDNEESTTSPIELLMLDKDGSEILKSRNKIFVDNFNRFAIGPDTEGFLAFSEGIDTRFSSRIKYNYPTEESIRALTGKELRFNEVSEGNKDLVLGRLRDYWETLTPETRDSIEYIEFADNDYFNEKLIALKLEEGTIAFATSDRGMVFRANSIFDFSIFKHESAHERYFQTNRETNFLTETFFDSFEEEWKEITKDISYSNNKVINVGNILSGDYSEDAVAVLEEEGVIRAYSYTNINEDIATFVGEINNPQFFKSLINPKSEDYNPIYRQKLDLLHEFKFISDNEYNKVLEVAGVK